MQIISDLHIHSRYSRATSPTADLPNLARWAKIKGITLLGTGDFTHPQWYKELQEHLVPVGNGLYRYGGVLFMLTVEVSAIWSQGGKVRKAHLVILAPSIEGAARINSELGQIGNLAADGRPILGISAERLVELIWNAEEGAEVIPAHVWTPWFSVFGSRSGFDSLEECFGKYTDRIFAIETGLSSDAHSPGKLGREATLFDLPEPSYAGIIAAMKERDPSRFLGTIEFYPQEGKYHYDGHRACGIVLSPREAMANNNLCPVCGKPLTIGVMHRVEDLADRQQGEGPAQQIPYRSLVPLKEIIAQALGIGPTTKGVAREYERLITHFGNEFRILLDLPEEDLRQAVSRRILQGILKVRAGDLQIEPGYDGVYGKVTISLDDAKDDEQLGLF